MICILKKVQFRQSLKILLCLILGSTVFVVAQKRNPLLNPTGFDDVVFGIAFSPDGQTLAIARGAAEPSQRFGRIELWDTETGKLRRVIKGFDGPAMTISYAPDGQTIISGSLEYRSEKIQDRSRYSGTVKAELKWWDNQTGELKQRVTMPGDGNSSLKLTLSPDGKDLLVAETFMTFSFITAVPPFQPPTLGGNVGFPTRGFGPLVYYNSDMKLLDATTGEIRQKLNDDAANSLAYSPDGSLVALAHRGEVKLFNSQTGKDERKLKGFKGRPNALAFSPDGRILAVSSTNYERESAGNFDKIIGFSQVKLFDTRSWREMRKINNVGAVNTLAFSPNGRLLLMGGVMSQGEKEVPGVNILNLDTSQAANISTGEDFTEAVDSLAVSNDGKLMAFRTGQLTVKMLDTKTMSVRQTWDSHSIGELVERPVSRFLVSVKRVLAVAFSRDGRMLTAETDQGEIKSWDPRTGELKHQLAENHNNPTFVTTSADGNYFADLADGKVFFWSSNNNAKQPLDLPKGRIASAVAVQPDGQLFAVGCGDEILFVDGGGKPGKVLKLTHGVLSGLAFSEDGHKLAALAENGSLDVWDLSSDRVEQSLTVGPGITAIRFAPGAQRLATASADREITLWNLQNGQALMKLDKHDAAINAIAFSADGQWMASGSDDRSVIIWDLGTGKSKRTLKGHDQTVTSVAFSPDGKFLASGSGNASVVIWEVRSGKFNRVLR